MRLRYYESTNFGDALNPFIFNTLLPDFFDNDPSIDFFGIGSILGFEMVTNARRKVVFSSGFAYGTKPKIDDSYDIFCVRGPLTAKALNLDSKLAIVDGAMLLNCFPLQRQLKKYEYSFMPHWESELKFDWRKICEKTGVHYISPMQGYQETIEEIQKSKVVIAEAMHAAIVADSLRVPWIPVKAYQGINDFKWSDWTSSLNLPYSPNAIRSLFSNTQFVRDICKKKLLSVIPGEVYGIGLEAYEIYQKISDFPSVVKKFEHIKLEKQYLSKDELLHSKVTQLRDRIDLLRSKYVR
jgi:succinoglycan biosynthesis protein ExoV